MSNLLKPVGNIRTITRNVKTWYNWQNEGIQYPGFKYYPRHRDFKDPPYEPTKLFRVQRLKPVKGCPYWEKDILKELKLDGKLSEISIVKNIPEINARLWRIKHLVRITPITFPNGFPEDTAGTYLKENGEFLVTKKLTPIENRWIASEKFEKDQKKLDGDTLRRESRVRWLNAWQSMY